jgi:hypothetical protein
MRVICRLVVFPFFIQVVLGAAAVGRGAWQHVPYRTCKLTHVLLLLL